MAFRFIAGNDDFLVQRMGTSEWQQLCATVDDPLSHEVVDGHASTVGEAQAAVTNCIAAIQTISLFSPVKVVWLRNVSFLADSVTGRSETTLAAIDKLIAAIESMDSSAVQLLVTAAPVDRRRKPYKWLHANGESTFVEVGKDHSGLVDILKAEAQAHGVTFAKGAAEILISKLNGNTRLAIEETGKLITFLEPPESTITIELLNALVPAFGEGDFYEPVEAFFSANLQWTLDAIHRHFFAGNHSRPVISGLQNRNRLLLQLKALQVGKAIPERFSPNAVSALPQRFPDVFDFPSSGEKSSFNLLSNNPWYLKRLSEDLHRFSLKQLMDFQHAFAHCFLETVSRPNDQESVMRELAIQCLAPTASV